MGPIRFIKILEVGPDLLYMRPFVKPPELYWWLEPGVPMLLIRPNPAESQSEGQITVLEVARRDLEEHLPNLCAVSGVQQAESDASNKLVIQTIPVIRKTQFEQLLQVEPSKSGSLEYRPCRVQLKNGKVEERVRFAEASQYIRLWGSWPQFSRPESSISIADVVLIKESPYRLPPKLATKMYEAGESGMGYCIFTLVLKDGRRLPCASGNAVDFVNLPPDVAPDDIVDLIPHEGRGAAWPEPAEVRPASASGEPRVMWCLFRTS